jgi:hypothetical protein
MIVYDDQDGTKRVREADAIAVAEKVALADGHFYPSDEEALEDFIAVHWAWREPDCEDMLGKPFSAADWNCWSLVREVFARGGLALPDYPYSDPQTRATLAAEVKGQFVRLEGPQPWCIIALSHINGIVHCGIVLPDCLNFIHVREQTGTVINKISQYRNNIEGYYTWHE